MELSKNISITWSPQSKKVTLAYRGEKLVIPGTYESAEAGVRAGRKFMAEGQAPAHWTD